MTNEKLFPQYDFQCRYCRTAPEFPVAAQAVVAYSDGHGSVTLCIALDFCLRLWCWTIYLYPFLNQSKGTFVPLSFLPWLNP